MKFCVSEMDAKMVTCPLSIPTAVRAPCEGSRCMAWRWVETHIKNPDAPAGDLIYSDDTHGYCGIAGDPMTGMGEAAIRRATGRAMA